MRHDHSVECSSVAVHTIHVRWEISRVEASSTLRDLGPARITPARKRAARRPCRLAARAGQQQLGLPGRGRLAHSEPGLRTAGTGTLRAANDIRQWLADVLTSA